MRVNKNWSHNKVSFHITKCRPTSVEERIKTEDASCKYIGQPHFYGVRKEGTNDYMVVKTYKEINRSHVISHGIYDIFIMPFTNNNPKDNYDLFRHSIRFTLKQVIEYVDTLKSTSNQYEIDCLDWSGRYMRNYLDP